MILLNLFEEKVLLLERFLEQTKNYRVQFNQDVDMERKLDWVDELSDLREENVRVMHALDQEIEESKKTLNSEAIEKLQGHEPFRVCLEKTLQLIKEIQLTDQSLFLYIQTMGTELRARILKSLKEKEAVSKFKSQVQTSTGDELDQTV